MATTGDPGSGSAVGLHAAEGLAATGLAHDGKELAGRRLMLQIAAPDPSDVAFWIPEPSGDERLLAVISRDTRSGAQRMAGLPSRHGIEPFAAGSPIVVSGVVERLPPAEERYSWRLTAADVSELADRPIYLRIDSAKPVSEPQP